MLAPPLHAWNLNLDPDYGLRDIRDPVRLMAAVRLEELLGGLGLRVRGCRSAIGPELDREGPATNASGTIIAKDNRRLRLGADFVDRGRHAAILCDPQSTAPEGGPLGDAVSFTMESQAPDAQAKMGAWKGGDWACRGAARSQRSSE